MVTPRVVARVPVVKVMRRAVPVSAASASLTVSVRVVRRVRVPVVRVVMAMRRVGVLVRAVMVTPRVVARVPVVKVTHHAVRVSAANVSLTVSVRDVRRVRVPVVRVVMVTPRVGVLVRVVMIVVPAVRSAKNVLSVR
jgi:hypothetical protein